MFIIPCVVALLFRWSKDNEGTGDKPHSLLFGTSYLIKRNPWKNRKPATNIKLLSIGYVFFFKIYN